MVKVGARCLTRTGAVLMGALLLLGGCARTPVERSRAVPLPPPASDAALATPVGADLDDIPVSFVANRGRWDARASWVAAGREATAYFVDGGVRWALPGWALDQVLVGARPAPPVASVAAPGVVSYFGERAAGGLPTATELTLERAWPGVDVTWSGAGGHIEATYHLAAGADPAQVRVAWQGAESVALASEGRLAVTTPVRTFEEDAPKAFQDVDGRRVPVEVAYELHGPTTYGFRLGTYEPSRPLVIDPAVLLYASFLGGAGGDAAYDVAVDATGNTYVAGSTTSTATSFPETPGAFQVANSGDTDAFVAKVNPTGSALLYASFLGGTDIEVARGIAVDGAGNAVVTGYTHSTNFPTADAVQAAAGGLADAFVTKLNPSGSALLSSTYLGGAGTDVGHGIALDAAGNAYVTGYTVSADFPTANALQATAAGSHEAFVTKLNAAGSALVYSTYLGGTGADVANAVAVDGAGNAYIVGQTQSVDFPTANALQAVSSTSTDAFVTKLDAAGSALVYSTYLGGAAHDGAEGVAVDPAGNAYVTGITLSANFPTANALQASYAGNGDAFAAKLNPAGSGFVYSTFLGGSAIDGGSDIAVDAAGNASVTGNTNSTDFPTANAFQPTHGGGIDAFVTKLDVTGSALVHSTYLGGDAGDAGTGIALDGAAHAYVSGYTFSGAATSPETPGVFQPAFAGGPGDAFVAKIADQAVLATPTLSTQASAGGLLGTAVRDVAMVAGGDNPGGSVTFRLFSDATCTTEVFTSTNPLAGATATSGDFVPTAPGTYRWTAVYSGDPNNNPATSPCNAPNESVVITPFQAPPFTRTLTGDVLGPVTVAAGESVLITGARVVGPVTVDPGGALTVVNSQISRGVVAISPSFFSMCGTQVSGPAPATALSVTGAAVPVRVGDPASGCAGNRFAGQVVLSGNAAVTFGANTVSHDATLENNGPGLTIVKANTVFGTLGCAGNNPVPTDVGQANTAGAKAGQCAAI